MTRSLAETVPGMPVKMRTMIWLASYIQPRFKTNPFIRMIAYYSDTWWIGVEEVGRNTFVLTGPGGESLWMTRLTILYNAFFVSAQGWVDGYEQYFERAVRFMVADPFVNARVLKKYTIPFMMGVGAATGG